MFKEYSFRDWLIGLLCDIPFFMAGCYLLSYRIGMYMAGIVFVLLCIMSTIKTVMELQEERINYLKKELDDIKKDFVAYKEQILEG